MLTTVKQFLASFSCPGTYYLASFGLPPPFNTLHDDGSLVSAVAYFHMEEPLSTFVPISLVSLSHKAPPRT